MGEMDVQGWRLGKANTAERSLGGILSHQQIHLVTHQHQKHNNPPAPPHQARLRRVRTLAGRKYPSDSWKTKGTGEGETVVWIVQTCPFICPVY